MSANLQTVLISLLTSLLVSLFTFILGLRSGKNQADRSKVRQIYQSIFSQFDELKRFITENRPRTWWHYEKEILGLSSYRHIAPIKKLEHDGELLLIKKSLARRSVVLEEKAVNYGSKVFYAIDQFHNALANDISLYSDGSKFKKYQGAPENAHFETANPTNCNSFIECDYRDFIDREKIETLFLRLEGEPCALEFRLQTQSKVLTYKIYPQSINCSIDVFLQKIYAKFETEIDKFKELCNQKEALLTEISKLNEKISKRAKEPFSFWETLLGAFGDIFR